MPTTPHLTSFTTHGSTGHAIKIQIDHSPRGLNRINIIGLPSTSTRESRERLRASLRNNNLRFPKGKITINLAPTNLPKTTNHHELAIALGLILLSKKIPLPDFLKDSVLLGQLSLTGDIQSIPYIYHLLIQAHQQGYNNFLIPFDNLQDLPPLPKSIHLFPLKNIKDLLNLLDYQRPLPHYHCQPKPFTPTFPPLIKGHAHAKYALALAAIGHHHLFLFGSPGSGKTLLANYLPHLLTEPTPKELQEINTIHSLAKIPPPLSRPMRTIPPHTTKRQLLGGGPHLIPGEISLAHNGVLFAEEINLWPTQSIDQLRLPLEEKQIHLGRNQDITTFPSNFIFLAASNPCPCGYLYDSSNQCICSTTTIQNYTKKISGAIKDRIDLFIYIPKTSSTELIATNTKANLEEFKILQTSIKHAKSLSLKRQGFPNSDIRLPEQQDLLNLTPESLDYLKTLDSLSSRSLHKIMRIARTVADFGGDIDLTPKHLKIALKYRFQNQL